jgi:iron complex transport system substrate-binding protein
MSALAGEAPQRVVSANLCSDQLLMSLADREQIASLSPLARDASISYLADRAHQFVSNRASGEDLLRADADLVLIGQYDNRYTRSILEMRHIQTLTLEPWSTLTAGRAQIASVAEALGHADRGVALLAEIDRSLARLPRIEGDRRPSFLTLHRRGFVYHAGLANEVLAAAGMRDAAPDFGLGAYGFVTLEALVQKRPDFLVIGDEVGEPEDNGQAFLVHPTLLQLWPPEKRIFLAGRLTICGGPSTPALIEALGAELLAKVPGAVRR